MKDNRINGAEELEKELRSKMSELSANVDCFDKISARAFPEKDQAFSDSELTVSDLENVTGRRSAVPILKWVSIAAAVVFCLGVLPRTVFFQDFMANISTDTNKKYRGIISEIQSETKENDYKVYDMPLSEYVKDDILVTPLYSCPFEAEDSDDISVRVFVREIDGLPTNQIYAVEYTGDYSESNFLAAAESNAKFTDKDVEAIGVINIEADDGMAYMAACNAFTGDRYFMLTDENGKRATAASFSYVHIFKYDDTVKALQTQALYCNYANESDTYYYDTLTRCYDEKNKAMIEYEMPEAKKLWKTSLNYDGSNAMPEENDSDFIKKDFFANITERDDDETLSWYEPYSIAADALVDDKVQTMRFGLNADSIVFKTPADSIMKQTMCIYEPYITHFMYSSQSDPTIDISIDGRDEQIIVHNNDIQGAFAELGKNIDTTSVIEFSDERLFEGQEQIRKEVEKNRQAYEQEKEVKNEAEITIQPYESFIFSTDSPFILKSEEQK
ncbi:hypothetical protein [Ruminococcus sp.]|uniref:hypothetical protein n=1 Tax=Ruminococcus sp. TaxID=41978 RepID=UPI0025CBB743|nr:hypothetical protein [Ruminococcus sp.]MCR4638828.1 hypothetical protein [Ruminococcus sp.]